MSKLKAKARQGDPSLIDFVDQLGEVVENAICVPGSVRVSATQIECMARVVITINNKEKVHEDSSAEDKDFHSDVQSEQGASGEGANHRRVSKTKRSTKADTSQEPLSE